jgi:hypothetical protein
LFEEKKIIYCILFFRETNQRGLLEDPIYGTGAGDRGRFAGLSKASTEQMDYGRPGLLGEKPAGASGKLLSVVVLYKNH